MSAERESVSDTGAGSAPEQEGGYLRVLSLFDATLLVVGCIIGGGVFFNPGRVAGIAHEPWACLGAWVLGGVVALTGALTYAELGGLYPRAGGVYVFLKHAFGRLPAFLCAWSVLLIIAPGALALVADFFAENLRTFAPGITEPQRKWIASGVIALLTLVNCRGVKLGSVVLNAFTLGKLAALGCIALAGLVWSGPPGRIESSDALLVAAPAHGPYWGMLLALVPVLFTYGGWQNATFVAAEVKEPARNVPRSMLIGTLIVIAVYVSVNASFLAILEPASMAHEQRFATVATERALGAWGARIVSVGILMSTFGICSAMLLANPRLVQAVSADGCFFRSLGELHPRWRTPHRAIALLGAWSIALLWTGRAGDLTDSVVFADWVFFGLCGLALFVFRRKLPQLERPYRCPLYPWVPALFVALALVTIGSSIANAGLRSLLLGVGLLALGLPVFWFFERARRRAA